jgi:uncharacterized oligopeptide transporter (OPT) family protein
LTGTLASCLAYSLLVPNASVFAQGAEGEPPVLAAPAARQWEAVARVLATGLDQLHPVARTGLLAGALLGVLLALVEVAFPRARRVLPSAMGLGLGLMLPFYQPLAMFLGAMAVVIFRRASATRAERFVIPIASGIIVGESVVGIVVQAANHLGR